jgi:hypothetical protein
MENTTLPLLQFRSKELSSQISRQSSSKGFFDLHPIAVIVRSLFLSSLLWAFLAIVVYTVYTMIVGAH